MSKLPKALCERCPLQNEPVVPPSGPLDAEVAFVAEAPGAVEVAEGRPLVGPSGKLLDAILVEAGCDPASVYRTNVVACRPPGNRTPTALEIECCRPRLEYELEQLTRARLVTLGKVAHEVLVPEWDLSKRGMWLRSKDRWVLPTWHPAYVLRKPSAGSALVADVYKGLKEPVLPAFVTNEPRVILVRSAQELHEILATVPDGSWVAFDTETNQTQWYTSRTHPANSLLMLQLAWEESFGVVLDDVLLYDVPETSQILNHFFARVRPVAHNGKFDQLFLHTIGVHVSLAFDTMLAHYALDESPPHGLKELVGLEFNMPDYEERLIAQYLTSRNDDYSKVPFDALARYGVLDVVAVLALRRVYEERLIAQGRLEWPFQKLLMRAANLAVGMELRGIPVDVNYLVTAQAEYSRKLAELLVELRELSGVPTFNPNSVAQVAHVLYDILKLPVPKTRKGSARSTNHEALEQLEHAHPLVDALLRYRRVAKMKSSYLDNFLEYVDADGYIHPTILLHGTETGRLAMRNPAAQTIPRAQDPTAPGYDPWLDGAAVKAAICASPGKTLAIADLSQAELRTLAFYSKDEFLLKVYQEERDLHTEVAIAMFGENYTKEERVRCKMFNFSWAYGGNEHSFARDQGLNIEVARQFVRRYNQLMKGAVRWKEEQFEFLRRHGYIETIFGRRRHFPFLTPENVDEARKAAVNMPVQSTASDITLLAAIDLVDAGIPVVHLVHDSIIAEVPEAQGQEVAQFIAFVLERTGEKYMPEVRWKADPEVARRWAEPPQRF